MSAGPTRRRLDLALAVGVALVAALPFAPVRRNGFLTWDDTIVVLGQPFLRAATPANLLTLLSPLPPREEWLPVRDLTLLLHFATTGDDPRPFALGDVALHAAAAVAAFALFRRLLASRTAAFVAGCVFACHAVHVESVAWISGRKDPLSTLLLLLALLGWGRYRDGRGSLAAPLVAFGLALLAKASAFVLPGLLLAWDLARPGLGPRRRLLPLAPFCALGAAHVLLYVHLTRVDGVIEPYPQGGLLTVVRTDVVLLAHYLRDLVVPLHHRAIYEVEFLQAWLDPRLLGSLALLALLAALAWRARRVAPWTPLALALFLGGLLPFLNLIPHGIYYAERYLYVPSLGWALVLGALAGAAARRGPRERRVAAAVLALYLAAHALTTTSRCRVWQDPLTFWRHQAAELPGNPAPVMNLGETLELLHDDAGAEAAYARLCVPGRRVVPEAVYRLARVARRSGDLRLARARFLAYARLVPGDPRGKNDLAEVELASGEPERALALYREVVAEHPAYLLARANLARVLVRLGRDDEAREHWTFVVEHAVHLQQRPLVEEARRALGR